MTGDSIKVECSKCHGRGVLNWTSVNGGKCYSCNGLVYFVTTKANEQRKAERIAKRRQSTQARINKGRQDIETNHKQALKALGHLIGPETKGRMELFPLVRFETMQTLSKIYRGDITKDKQPWVFRNLSR